MTSHCRHNVGGRWLTVFEICGSAFKHHLSIHLLNDLQGIKFGATFLVSTYSSFGFLCLKKPLEIEAPWRYR
jgi:hypothetical protein